jgi:hypothetical protein
LGQKKTEEWEEAIFAKHESCKGQDKLITQMLYLQIVRQWPCYGCTFFRGGFKPSSQAFYKQDFSGTVAIGVNGYGVHMIEPIEKVSALLFRMEIPLTTHVLFLYFSRKQCLCNLVKLPT